MTLELGTLNFTTAGYTPPGWGAVYEFVEKDLIQLYSNDTYVFVALDIGLEVYEIESESVIAYTYYTPGFTSVAGNASHIYLGTSTTGVKRLSLSAVSGTTSNKVNLATSLVDWAFAPELTSNTIRCINATDNGVLVTTNSGIDYFKVTGNPQYRSYTTVTGGGYQCFLTDQQAYYVTLVTGTNTYYINRINRTNCDWTAADYQYYTGDGILASGLTINGIYVTYMSAADGGSNTLFCATSSGVYIIDESNNYRDIYYTVTA